MADVFGPVADVRLFGSRLDDNAKGRDIDLLAVSDAVVHDREEKILRLVARLQLRLGDQPIDVLVVDRGTPRLAIHAPGEVLMSEASSLPMTVSSLR